MPVVAGVDIDTEGTLFVSVVDAGIGATSVDSVRTGESVLPPGWSEMGT